MKESDISFLERQRLKKLAKEMSSKNMPCPSRDSSEKGHYEYLISPIHPRKS